MASFLSTLSHKSHKAQYYVVSFFAALVFFLSILFVQAQGEKEIRIVDELSALERLSLKVYCLTANCDKVQPLDVIVREPEVFNPQEPLENDLNYIERTSLRIHCSLFECEQLVQDAVPVNTNINSNLEENASELNIGEEATYTIVPENDRTTAISQGATGQQGPAGIGIVGPQGISGIMGPVGPMGPNGPQGADGESGRRGGRGPAGQDATGSDAFNLDETSAIYDNGDHVECLNDQNLLQWSATLDAWTCIAPGTGGIEALTIIQANLDGSFSYFDENGNETVISVSNLETLTSLNALVSGNLIGEYTNENNTVYQFFESITDIVENNDGTFTFYDETGAPHSIDIANLETVTTLTNFLATGSQIGTYTNEDGVVIDFNESITTLTDNGDGTFTFTHEGGGTSTLDAASLETLTTLTNFLTSGNQIGTYTNEDGVIVDFNESITSLVDNGDGTLTFTQEGGGTQTIDIGANIANLETLTAITNTIAGNRIATYTDEDGNTWDINETITTIVDNGDGSFDFTNENGDTVTFTETLTTLTNFLTSGNQIGTYTNEDGVIVDFNESITSLVDNGDGTLTFTQEGGGTQTIDIGANIANLETLTAITNTIAGNRIATYTDEDGNTWDINETITTIVDNGDGSFDFTNENGDTVTFTETLTYIQDENDGTYDYYDEDGNPSVIDTKDFVVDASSAIYNDGKIECVNSDEFLQWDGSQWACAEISGSVSGVTDNNDGTFTHTDGNGGAPTIVDTKDFVYDTNTVEYIDGKIQCVKDEHFLQWQGAPGNEWICTELNINFPEYQAGDGLVLNADTFSINLSTDDTGSGTESNSGLEFAVDGGLQLLGGCDDGQHLQWDDIDAVWECSDIMVDACLIGSAYVGTNGTLINSNGIIDSSTRNNSGEYIVNFDQALAIDEYTVQLTAHGTQPDTGISDVIINLIGKGPTSIEVHTTYGDNGGGEDVGIDMPFEVLIHDLACDPTALGGGMAELPVCSDGDILQWSDAVSDWECVGHEEEVPFVYKPESCLRDNTANQTITIEGFHFDPNTSFAIPGLTITNVNILSPTESELTIDTSNAGNFDIIANNSGELNTDVWTGNGQGFIEVCEEVCLIPDDDTPWQNVVGVSTGVGNLAPTGSVGWNKGASFGTVPAGNDFQLDMFPTSTSGNAMFGVSTMDADQNYTTIGYAIYFVNTAVYVFENGANKGNFSNFSTGDEFSIRRVGTTVSYLKNGSVFYTSTIPSTTDIVFDSSIYTTVGAKGIEMCYGGDY